MPGLFSRLKGRDGQRKKKNAAHNLPNQSPQKPKWDDAYTRKSVEPEEIHELLHFCTTELKARGLDIPFLLLPYRPTSDPSAVRTFVRRFFDDKYALKGETLSQELRMTEPMVISGVVKWCWSRLAGGVVGWDAYELFKIGEGDSRMARDSFKTFVPLSVESGSRQRIIFDFFDLVSAIAAHGKSNGFGGRQLPRMAAWWAFEQKDTGDGFDGGYKAWLKAADATSHLFLAYLRSLSPEDGVGGISMLPRSLEKLLNDTSYPPTTPATLVSKTNKLVMLVDSVSPTPFALLRRAGHFQYRDSDAALQEFSEYEDPVQALTEECLRVLRSISAANQSQVSSSKHSTSLRDASWSRFEDIGFAATVEDEEVPEETLAQPQQPQGLRATPTSGIDLGRPTTPSWADFLSSGFVDENQQQPNVLLPPDKVLPPIETQVRQQSSQSHRPRLESEEVLQPGELASITVFDLDDAFWWVWMSSLAPEETADRKAAFGRCAIVETKIHNGRWLVMEEKIAGAAEVPDDGAYIAEKKSLFSWTKRGRSLGRRKSIAKYAVDRNDKNASYGHGSSKTHVGPDTHARIAAKAAQMRAVQEHETQASVLGNSRRGRADNDLMAEKTNSVLTLQPHIVGEASSAMKWVKKYDKGTIKDAYMANSSAGRGLAVSSSTTPTTEPAEGTVMNGSGIGVNGAANGALAGPGHSRTNGTPHYTDKRPNVPAKDIELPALDVKATEKSDLLPAATTEQMKESEPEQTVNKAPALDVEQIAEKDDIPPPPPKDDDTVVDAANVPLPAEPLSESTEANKYGFQAPREKSGLRKLFSRRNRSSKVPDNASANLAAMLPKEPAVAEESSQKTPVAEPTPTFNSPTPATVSARESVVEQDPEQKDEHNVEATVQRDHEPEQPLKAAVNGPTVGGPSAKGLSHDTQEQSHQGVPHRKPAPVVVPQAPVAEPTYEPPADEGKNYSPVDARDAAEAKHEFSKFDQGPLMDQPAMMPMDSVDEDDEDDATPPPIARHPPTQQETPNRPTADEPLEKLSQSASPGVQDRWAQIRKNAATRAATRKTEPTSRTSHTKGSGEDDDTSVEETIESRVARIKARVAELTGNMETGGGPQQGSPKQPAAGPQ